MSLPAIKKALLTNNAYGFPRGKPRRHKPHILMVIHITGNPNNQGSNAAMNERNYANRNGSNGPSAHFYLDRDGGGVRAINPYRYAAWSNGDINKPNTNLPSIRRMLRHHSNGFNANECVAVEIECVGYAKPAGQITDAQKDRLARMVAWYSGKFGISITRNHVIGHADIDSVNRAHCPSLDLEPFLRDVIDRANFIAHPLPKSITLTWDQDPPDNLTTTVLWTPGGFKVMES